MSDIATLIQETTAMIAATKAFVAADPTDFYALMQLQTLEQRLVTLQARFDAISAENRIQVLRYRLIVEQEQPSVRVVNDLLATFQQSFTVVYDSIVTHSAKKRARVSEASLRDSSFGFAYSFSSSLGFALTLPEELTLLSDEHSNAIRAVEDLLTVATERDIKAFAETYGLGAVRTLYKWIDAVVKSGFDAVLEWHHRENATETFLVQVAAAHEVRNLISQTSDVEYEERSYRGTLVAYDSVRRTFRFSVRNAAMIHGAVSEALTERLTVPAPYSIQVRVATTRRYSSDEKEETFELLRLA